MGLDDPSQPTFRGFLGLVPGSLALHQGVVRGGPLWARPPMGRSPKGGKGGVPKGGAPKGGAREGVKCPQTTNVFLSTELILTDFFQLDDICRLRRNIFWGVCLESNPRIPLES